MLSDEIIQRVFAHKSTKFIPIAHQVLMLDVLEEVISKYKEEKPYATISELLPDADGRDEQF